MVAADWLIRAGSHSGCRALPAAVRALAFTLSRRSPNFTGELSDERYAHIFANAVGRYGSSLDYAEQTLLELRRHAIHDAALARLVKLAQARLSAPADSAEPEPPVYPLGSASPPRYKEKTDQAPTPERTSDG